MPIPKARVPPITLRTGTREEMQAALNTIRDTVNRALDELDGSIKSNLRSSPDGLPVGAVWNDKGVIKQV